VGHTHWSGQHVWTLISPPYLRNLLEREREWNTAFNFRGRYYLYERYSIEHWRVLISPAHTQAASDSSHRPRSHWHAKARFTWTSFTGRDFARQISLTITEGLLSCSTDPILSYMNPVHTRPPNLRSVLILSCQLRVDDINSLPPRFTTMDTKFLAHVIRSKSYRPKKKKKKTVYIKRDVTHKHRKWRSTFM
jgi:hypothetical protein